MIYAIYILIGLLVAAIVIIVNMNDRIKYLVKRYDNIKEDQKVYQKACKDYENEIWCLIEGGLIQKEAVEIKYKDHYKKTADSQKMAMEAQKQRSRLMQLSQNKNNALFGGSLPIYGNALFGKL